jgi:cell division protein FtsQ
LKANKKIRRNRFLATDPEVSVVGSDFMTGLDFVLKFILLVLVLTFSSLGLIFIHDFITQSTYFNLRSVTISGTERLTHSDILARSGIKIGDNILALNLKTARKRLSAHPWIRDAAVERHVPSTLSIKILEQKAIARASLSNSFEVLLDLEGQPFKIYEPELEPLTSDLPKIQGLELESLNPILSVPTYGYKGKLHRGVLELLGIGDTYSFREISADKDLGIEVATDIFKTHTSVANEFVILKLGFDRFKAKLAGADRILDFLDEASYASGDPSGDPSNAPSNDTSNDASGEIFGNALGKEKGVGMIDLFNIRSVTITLADKGVLPSTTKGGV